MSSPIALDEYGDPILDEGCYPRPATGIAEIDDGWVARGGLPPGYHWTERRTIAKDGE
jgi:hypothetical protein